MDLCQRKKIPSLISKSRQESLPEGSQVTASINGGAVSIIQDIFHPRKAAKMPPNGEGKHNHLSVMF